MKLSITDNNLPGKLFEATDMEELLPFGNKSLKELCAKNEDLLVFPAYLDEMEDKLGDNTIFSYTRKNNDYVNVTTSNIIGVVGCRKQQLTIRSRFDSEGKDYFLYYMFQKVFSLNLFDFDCVYEHEGVFDLLLFLFPHYLKNAMRQGLYREYIHKKNNDSKLSGTIDIARHIRNNIPENGKIAYNTREYSCDNNMTQLIRHTIEFIRNSKYGESILEIDKATKDYTREICDKTESYSKSDKKRVILSNLRKTSHPYYSEYIPLKELCLSILRYDEILFGDGEQDFYGLLFDGAWLWEEYCNTLLMDFGFVHPENKKGKNAISLFKNNRCPRYPDFYKEGVVIDAKYKRYGEKSSVYEVSREDLHQIVTYMFIRKAHHGAFICPISNEQSEPSSSELNGYPGIVALLGIEIAQDAKTFDEFCKIMKSKEQKVIKDIEDFLKRE